MKVRIFKTGETAVFSDGYAARLIEQRKAAPDNTKGEKTEKADKPVKKAE